MAFSPPQTKLDSFKNEDDTELIDIERLSALETEKKPSNSNLEINNTLCNTIDPTNFQDLMASHRFSVSPAAPKTVQSDLGWLAMNMRDGTASFQFDRSSQDDVTENQNPFDWNVRPTAFTSPFVGVDHPPQKNLVDNNPAAPISIVQPHNRRKEKVPCTHQGCTKTFGRTSELRRHLKLHSTAPNIPCTVEGCPRMFHRMDNRRAHERRVHKIFI